MLRVAESVLSAMKEQTQFKAATPSLWVAFGLAAGTAAALGLARFAYSLLLPTMQIDLHWSYAQAGTLNTAIAAGYLLGALLMPRLEHRFGARRTFLGGLLMTGLALLVTALFRNYPALLALRFAAGLATAWVFVSGFSLAARAGANANRSTLFTSIYMTGVGLGMALSGVLLPSLLASGRGWQAGWLALGILTLFAAFLAVPAVRRVPAASALPSGAEEFSLRGLRPIFFAYFIYGAGYFALMTFVIAYLHASGYSERGIVEFWIIIGLAMTVSMFLWGPLLARLRSGWGVAATTGVFIVSALMLLLLRGETAIFISALLFGGSILASAFSQLDYARRLTPPQVWTRLIAGLTVVFSLGQMLGPALCGWVSDLDGLRAGMFTAMGLLLVCIVAALLQRQKFS